jgi:hypothetical protein
MMSDTGPGKFGFAARRQRLLICFAGALSLAATGSVSSAAAHPHAQRRSCAGLLAVHDFPGAVNAEPPVNKALHGVFTSFCAYGSGGNTAAGGVDQLTTFPSSAAARAAFARNGAAGEKLAKAETHTITEGQFKIKTTVTSDYFSAGLINGNESAFDILHTTQVTTGPGPGAGSHSSSGTTGFIRVKNQIFAATLQNSLDPEHSTFPSQVRHLLRQVVREL